MRLPPAIKSGSHPLIHLARQLGGSAGARREAGLFLVEGQRGLAEALEAEVVPEWVLIAPVRADEPATAPLLRRLERMGVTIHAAQQSLLERVSPTRHGPGLLAACPLPDGVDDPAALLERAGRRVVVLTWEVQDPGNLGTLMRSAAAFGAGGLVALAGSDPWHPKAVRASAGAIHRLAVAREDSLDRGDTLLDTSPRLAVAAVARGGRPPSAVDWRAGVTLILGSEVRGLPPEIEAASTKVTIPIEGSVESLSVATAGSILLETAARARRRSDPSPQ